MLLSEMRLTNFRQFYGTQTVVFSTDKEKNITVIMGENGSGKTTLAQAFSWCLYGETDFDDKSVLNKKVEQQMGPSFEEVVSVSIMLVHRNTNYTITREQVYSTDYQGQIKKPSNSKFKISYKAEDGQQEYLKESETDIRMKEILPKELSRYFFFDGERIGNMSKEIRKGKSKEFAEAVKGLLGLSAFSEAIDHLNGRGKSVVKVLEDEYDASGDEKINDLSKNIERLEGIINDAEADKNTADLEMQIAEEEITKLLVQIRDNEKSATLAKRSGELERSISTQKKIESDAVSEVFNVFSKYSSTWLSTKLIKDALQELANANKIDVGIPDIHQRTIEYLINRKKCICGTCIEFGNEAYTELIKVLEYIPPKSVGTIIGQFVREAELKAKARPELFDEIASRCGIAKNAENEVLKYLNEQETIRKQLENMQDVGELQKRAAYFNTQKKQQEEIKDNAVKRIATSTSEKQVCEKQLTEMALKNDNNRRTARFRAYAIYMHDYIKKIYDVEETSTRKKLEETVNNIFKQIYDGGLSISLDEKYNIRINVDEFSGVTDVETSTAQSISVIFAFIAGVIKLARENKTDDSMLVTEPYPLVMDAPLSAFDKTRIQTVCDALPNVAEQVVIFIKDTDGEIAEEHMSKKIGKKYSFDKKNEFETSIVER